MDQISDRYNGSFNRNSNGEVGEMIPINLIKDDVDFGKNTCLEPRTLFAKQEEFKNAGRVFDRYNSPGFKWPVKPQ